MDGRGIRRDRGAAREERARLGAALALIVGLLPPAAGAQLQLEESEPTFDFLDDANRKEALAAWRTGDPDQVVVFAWGMAEALRQQSLEPEGIRLLDLVLASFDDSYLGPTLQAVRGDLKRSAGLFDAALDDLAEAEELARAKPDYQDYTLHSVHGFRAQVWLDMGLLLLADAELREEALVTAREVDAMRKQDHPMEAARLELASTYRATSLDLAMGEPRRAADRMAKLLSGDSLEAIPDLVIGARLRHGQFLVAATRDELRESTSTREGLETLRSARSTLEAALEGGLAVEEEIEARLTLVEAGWLSGDQEIEARELTILEELLARDPEAFLAEKQARLAAFGARRLLEHGDAATPDLEQALASVERAFARAESEWLATARTPAGLGYLHYSEQRLVVETWARLLIALHGPEKGPREALGVIARAQAIGTLTLQLNPEKLAARVLLDDHLEALPEGAGILVFLPSLDSSLVFAADRERVCFARLPADSFVEDSAAELGVLVRSYPSRPRAALVAKRAAALAEVLLPDEIARRAEGWGRVLIVGTELFGSPGLEPLPLGTATLGERLATSYLPSIPLAELLRRRAGQACSSERVAFLAATGLGKKPIELRKQEVACLERLVGSPGPGRFLEVGGSARSEALRITPETDVLAILGHGLYDARQLRPASIELADGPLDCDELERLVLPPVVCLLACGAARGPRVVGDAGTAHLGGAALVGGAEAVLVADTEVEVEATLRLFEAFLGRLRAGDPPDEALRRGRLAIAEREPDWNDPFFTSGLRLFGWGGTSSPAGDR